jgi:hypothetical protein
MNSAASSGSTLSDIESDFVPERHRLEITLVVQLLAFVPNAFAAVGDVVADHQADLRCASGTNAAGAGAGSDTGTGDVLALNSLTTFHCHFTSPWLQ